MGLTLPLRGYHWVALLVVCLVLDTVTAVQLPGVAWSKLQIWEASALAVGFHRGPVLTGTVIHNMYCRTDCVKGAIRPRITSPNTNLYRRGATL